MSAGTNPYELLEKRVHRLIEKYIEPTAKAESLAAQKMEELPQPDFDDFAAFRLLAHAELEGYFEEKARLALNDLQEQFDSGKPVTLKFAALSFLYLWKKRTLPRWAERVGGDTQSLKLENVDFKNLAQESIGYGRQFINDNNGIKENSIVTLSSLMGYFEDELDGVLVTELNQYGIDRGTVAHRSWTQSRKVNFSSAEDEKQRLLKILELIENFYEKDTAVKNFPKITFFKKLLNRFFH